MMKTALLSTAYFGPVQWFQKVNRYDLAIVDERESFLKQTYRNRCIIAAANGPQALTVPVERGATGDISSMRISDHGNWRHIHWNALCSAYGESPFFDYYEDDVRPFFEERWEYLCDYNMAIARKMCELLQMKEPVSTADVGTVDPSDVADFRSLIRPKHAQPDAEFQARPYWQVFAQKNGFLPNLSVLDLLFNMGNEAVLYL